jgi:hypothetical protein
MDCPRHGDAYLTLDGEKRTRHMIAGGEALSPE